MAHELQVRVHPQVVADGDVVRVTYTSHVAPRATAPPAAPTVRDPEAIAAAVDRVHTASDRRAALRALLALL